MGHVVPWKVLESSVTYADKWLTVRSDRCLTANGDVVAPYHVLEYPPWVNVVALTKEGEIVLLREYRHGVREIVLGLPGGVVDEGDKSLQAAAERELLEETGYGNGRYVKLNSYYANPSNQDNVATAFLVTGVEYMAEPKPDVSEEMEVVLEDFSACMRRLALGEHMMQGLHVAAIHFAYQWILATDEDESRDLRKALLKRLL